MTLAHPWFLLLWSGLLLLGLGFWRWQVRREQLQARYAEPRLLARMGVPVSRWRWWTKALLVLLGLGLLAVAAARPLGRLDITAVESQGLDLMILLDVSASMLARDVPAGNRLEEAKDLLRQWVQQLTADRVGLMMFAADPVVLCPLTTDYGTWLTFLNDVEAQTDARGGTALAEALLLAASRLPRENRGGQALLLLTDGEDQEGRIAEAGRVLAEKGIPVLALGLGSPAGAKIPLGLDFWGQPLYKEYQGQEITTRLNEPTLRRIAELTGGAYFRATHPRRLELIRGWLSQLEGRVGRRHTVARRREVFPWFVLPALGLLILEMLSPLQLRRAWKRIPCFLILGSALALGGWTWPGRLAEWLEAARDLDGAGRLAEAAEAYQRAVELAPEAPELRYNLGHVLYRLGRYEAAAAAWAEALERLPRGPLRGQAHYNRGNALYRLGRWEEAYRHYEVARQVPPADGSPDEDLEYNLALVRFKLRQQARQQAQTSRPDGPNEGPERGDQGPGGPSDPRAGGPENEPDSDLTEQDVDRLLRQLQEDEQALRPYFNPRPRSSQKNPLTEDGLKMSPEEFDRSWRQPIGEGPAAAGAGSARDW